MHLSVHGKPKDWLIAAALAAALNIGLFGIMPGLVQSVPQPPELSSPLHQVRVVRAKPKEQPIQKKAPEPVVQSRPKQTRTKQNSAPKAVPSLPRPALLVPDLGSPVLPQARLAINAPLLDRLDLEVPALKSSYEIGELDNGLTPLSTIAPDYPFRAKRRGIEGAVTVEFLVSPQGTVHEVTILDATPEKVFDRAVENALRLWRFQPPTVEGVPVAARARTTIRFKLEDS